MQIIHLAEFFLIDKQLMPELTEKRHVYSQWLVWGANAIIAKRWGSRIFSQSS
jgi:hypothetical protein